MTKHQEVLAVEDARNVDEKGGTTRDREDMYRLGKHQSFWVIDYI